MTQENEEQTVEQALQNLKTWADNSRSALLVEIANAESLQTISIAQAALGKLGKLVAEETAKLTEQAEQAVLPATARARPCS